MALTAAIAPEVNPGSWPIFDELEQNIVDFGL